MRESIVHLRNRVVKDWRKRNHTQSELDGIELYLNDGDPKHLPSIYRSSHEHWFPSKKASKHKIIAFDIYETTARCICWGTLRLVSFKTKNGLKQFYAHVKGKTHG